MFGAWRFDGTKWGAVSGVSGGGSAGDITAVLAGTGLSGGGTEGDVSIALAVPVSVARGGTGATDAATARTNLGAAPLAGPVFTGDPQAPTPLTADNDTSIATTAYVKAQGYLTPPANLASQVTGTLPVANGGTGATTGAVGPYLPLVAGSGNALTGGLILAPAAAGPEIFLRKPASGYANVIYGNVGALSRWVMYLGDGTAESGSNAGSNFILARYNDAGAFIDYPLTIYRNTGFVQIANDVYFGGAAVFGGTGSSYIYAAAGADITTICSGKQLWYCRSSDNLTYNNVGVVAGNGGYVNLASFAKYKSNVRPIKDPAERLKKLKPVAYTYDPLGEEQHGFVIEDLLDAYPEAVSYGPDGQPQGYKDTMILAGLTAALQDALARIEALEGK